MDYDKKDKLFVLGTENSDICFATYNNQFFIQKYHVKNHNNCGVKLVKFLGSIDFVFFLDEKDNSNMLVRKPSTMQYFIKKLFKFETEPLQRISYCRVKLELREEKEVDYEVEREGLVIGFSMPSKFFLVNIELKYEGGVFDKSYQYNKFFPSETESSSKFLLSLEKPKETFVLLHRCIWGKTILESFTVVGKRRIEHFTFNNKFQVVFSFGISLPFQVLHSYFCSLNCLCVITENFAIKILDISSLIYKQEIEFNEGYFISVQDLSVPELSSICQDKSNKDVLVLCKSGQHSYYFQVMDWLRHLKNLSRNSEMQEALIFLYKLVFFNVNHNPMAKSF